MQTLPHVLAPLNLPKDLPDASSFRVKELRKMGKLWGVADANKLPATRLEQAVAKAWKDDAKAQGVVASLNKKEQAILGVFRRYGGNVDGEVLRLGVQLGSFSSTVRQPDAGWSADRGLLSRCLRSGRIRSRLRLVSKERAAWAG